MNINKVTEFLSAAAEAHPELADDRVALALRVADDLFEDGHLDKAEAKRWAKKGIFIFAEWALDRDWPRIQRWRRRMQARRAKRRSARRG